MNICVIGLGLMGAAIALRLSSRGHEVVGWNRSPGPSEALSEQGITVVGTIGDAIEASEMVILALSDIDAIDAALFATGAASGLAGRTCIQMGTISPDESRSLARRLRGSGGDYLEAPVLGSVPEVREGRLIIMVGCESGLFDRVLPVLEDLSQSPQRIGEVGQGAALKLAMNQLIAGLTATFALSLGLVRREDIDVEQFMELLRDSALYAPTFDKKLPKYLDHAYGQANFPLKHLLKDIRLFRGVVEPLAMDTAFITAIEAACARALAKGYGEQDYSALYEALV